MVEALNSSLPPCPSPSTPPAFLNYLRLPPLTPRPSKPILSYYDKKSGGIGGGIFRLRKARLPFLTLYIQVGDIDKKAAQIAEAGGMVVEPPFDIGGGCRICLFNEPSGVTFAIIQQA